MKSFRFLVIFQAVLLSFLISTSSVIFLAVPTEQVHAAIGNLTEPVLLLHGLPASGQGEVDCGATWDHAKSYLQGYHDIYGTSLRWQGPIIKVKYYTGDTHCDADIHSTVDNPEYHRCDQYYYRPYQFGAEGTTSEDVYHLSCVLAWYIYTYNQRAGSLVVVGHSFGGLMIRNALYQVASHKAPQYFPPSLNVSAVVTLEAPHGGIAFARFSAWGCLVGACTPQLTMLDPGGYFMNEMYTSAQNPQATKGTRWTMMGSNCDGLVSTSSAVYMSGGYKVIYDQRSPTCPDHGTGLADAADDYNELAQWCNTCGNGTNADPPLRGGYYNSLYDWRTSSKAPHYLHAMMYALSLNGTLAYSYPYSAWGLTEKKDLK